MSFKLADLNGTHNEDLRGRFRLPETPWAPSLMRTIAAHAIDWEIPEEDVPALARNLNRLDFNHLCVDLAEASNMLGLHRGTVSARARERLRPWAPSITIQDGHGNARIKLWFRCHVEWLAEKRCGTSDLRVVGWRARKRRSTVESE